MTALILIAITAATATLMLVYNARRTAIVSPAPREPRSPIDYAERILAARYARGMITPEEYERMLAVLRH